MAKSKSTTARPVAVVHQPTIFNYRRDTLPDGAVDNLIWWGHHLHRNCLRQALDAMALSPMGLENLAFTLADKAEDPCCDKRERGEPVWDSDILTVCGTQITVGEYVAACRVAYGVVVEAIAEMPIYSAHDARIVLERLVAVPGVLPHKQRRIVAARMARFVADAIKGEAFKPLAAGGAK